MFRASSLAAYGGGSSVVEIRHPPPPPVSYDGFRSVLGVLVWPSTTTVTSITEYPGGGPGGWTLRGSHTAQDMSLYLFDKVCGPSEVLRYNVAFSAATSNKTLWLADFITDGAAMRTFGFADAASGTSLTLPTLTAVGADDLWGFAGSLVAGALRPDPPLAATGSQGGSFQTADGYQTHHSSAPTGTRSFTSASAPYSKGIGVMMLVGDYTPLGAWGVGQVRMGTG